MKKIIAVFLALIMCFGMTACKKEGQAENSDNTVKKSYKAVKITNKNWSEYFTFSKKHSAYSGQVDASLTSGEVTSVCIDFYFEVKSKYFPRLDTERSSINVKFSTKVGKQSGTFYNNYSSFEPSGEFTGKTVTLEGGDFIITPHKTFGMHIASASSNGIELLLCEMTNYLKGPKVLDISGTLYLSKK